jgi:hypothetical protein
MRISMHVGFLLVLAAAGCGSSSGVSPTGGQGGATGGNGGAGTGGVTGGTGGSSDAAAGGGGAGTGGASTGGTGGAGPDGAVDGQASCDGGCGIGRACCGGSCVNTSNDPLNCGQCGVRCEGSTPYCAGTCKPAPCARAACVTGQCCGNECCGAGQICCEEQGPIQRLPVCYTPTAAQPTCPQGCAPLCRSDRDQKTDIIPVDPAAVLERLSRLPVATWRYREEPGAVRHMGPMAQDFRAVFGLGDGDRYYHAVDAHGVALAAIQALERIAAQQRQRIEALEAGNRRLERKLRALEARR